MRKVDIFTVESNHRKDVNKDVYTFDEALDVIGNGWYSYKLLASLCLLLLSLSVDMFGFPIAVLGASCELQLHQRHKTILTSMPLAGAILLSYTWGYLSDTKGRRKVLLGAMSAGCAITVLSSLSPHWIVLAVMKFIGTSFISSVHICSYTLIGESCTKRSRSTFMLIMTSAIMAAPCFYYGVGSLVLPMSFRFDMGPIGSFVPWRLFLILTALPPTLGVICLSFCRESPKFLLNQGREQEAIDTMRQMWISNGKDVNEFPIKQLIVEEEQVADSGRSFIQSLVQQTLPIFQRPLLLRTLQLFFITFVVYSTNNAFLIWLPVIANKYFAASSDQSGLCDIFSNYQAHHQTSCTLATNTVIVGFSQSIFFTVGNLIMSMLASRKKMLMITLLLVSSAAGFTVTWISGAILIMGCYVLLALTALGMGLISAYYVDLYPTSYRGMVSCLGVIAARLSGIAGNFVVGHFIFSHCQYTFIAWAVFLLTGVVGACFLPADRKKQV